MKNKIAIIYIAILLLTACAAAEPAEPVGDPDTTSSKEIGWEQAQEMILSGEVKEIVQFHDRNVILTLDDGSECRAIEPELDDIFEVIKQCGEKCSEMSIITE